MLTIDKYYFHKQKLFRIFSDIFQSVKVTWDQKVWEPLAMVFYHLPLSDFGITILREKNWEHSFNWGIIDM